MQPGSPFSLVNEMLETPEILRRFDSGQGTDWARAVGGRKKLLVTGEGSSRIFPAKNLISLALRRGTGWHIATEGARQAAEYDLREFIVLAASNSGRTRELISLFEKLAEQGIARYGVTATGGSKIVEVSTDSRVLTCGPEKAVASSKSTVEQALVYQSLLGGDEWKNQHLAADYCHEVLAQSIPSEITGAVKNAPVVYFSGRNNGVAEELTLKANEITRKKSVYLEGTYALHGIEEVMRKDEVIILTEPFREEIEKYQKILGQSVGIMIVAISSFDTPFPTVKIPALDGFNTYLQLLAGWNVLVEAGIAADINIDKPERVRKIGNEI